MIVELILLHEILEKALLAPLLLAPLALLAPLLLLPLAPLLMLLGIPMMHMGCASCNIPPFQVRY